MLERPMKATCSDGVGGSGGHLCTPVVLLGDGLITFLTRRVPAHRTTHTHTHPQKKITQHAGQHTAHANLIRQDLPYLYSHLDSIYF